LIYELRIIYRESKFVSLLRRVPIVKNRIAFNSYANPKKISVIEEDYTLYSVNTGFYWYG